MTVLERFARVGIVPVVVIDDAKDAVPTANAMVAGGIDVMEITFRTAAAPDSIKAVAENCPDMLVGAGTILNLEQCKLAVECGAKFIVSPGYDEEVVKSKKYTHNVLLKRFGAIKSETMLLISLNRDCSKFVYKKVWSNQCDF